MHLSSSSEMPPIDTFTRWWVTICIICIWGKQKAMSANRSGTNEVEYVLRVNRDVQEKLYVKRPKRRRANGIQIDVDSKYHKSNVLIVRYTTYGDSTHSYWRPELGTTSVVSGIQLTHIQRAKRHTHYTHTDTKHVCVLLSQQFRMDASYSFGQWKNWFAMLLPFCLDEVLSHKYLFIDSELIWVDSICMILRLLHGKSGSSLN